MKRLLLILLTAVVVIVLGLFIINYTPMPRTDNPKSSTVSVEIIKNIVDQMFPDSKYTIKDNMIYFSTQIPANYQTLYLEQIMYGSFVEGKSEYLAVLRAPDDVTVHAGGLYYTIVAVFDTETNGIKSQRQDFTADEGEISILRGNGRDLVLFLGSSTFQGYISPTGGIYDPSQEYWRKTWPDNNDFWSDRYAVFGNDRLVLYKKVKDTVIDETILPQYHFEPDQELLWDRQTERLVSPIYK